jgi:hypothetical protein
LPIDQRVGQRKNDRHLVLFLALAIYPAAQLVELGSRPGQDVDDQAVADLLQAVHAGPDRAGADEHVHVLFEEAFQAGFVFARVESDLPYFPRLKIAGSARRFPAGLPTDPDVPN